MQEGDVFSCSACITVNWADDRVWRGVHWWYIGVLVWKRWWAGDMQHCAVSCPPAVRATAATALLGGPGHRLLSAPLSAASLTDRAGRERSNLYCGTIAKQQRSRKKPPSDDCIITQWMQSLPHQHFSFFSPFSFPFYPPLCLLFFFFSGRVSAN